MKKYIVTFINFEGKKSTKLCSRIRRYKKFIQLYFYEDYKGVLCPVYENVSYNNIIRLITINLDN